MTCAWDLGETKAKTETEVFANPSETGALMGLETASRLRRRDRDHIPANGRHKNSHGDQRFLVCKWVYGGSKSARCKTSAVQVNFIHYSRRRSYYTALHWHNGDVLESNITFFFIFAVLIVWYMSVDLTRRCKLLSFCLLLFILSVRTGPDYHLSRLFVQVSKYSSNFVARVYSWRDRKWRTDAIRRVWAPCLFRIY